MSEPRALPVSALHERPSASADAARMAEIARLKAMTPMERISRALQLGLETRRLTTMWRARPQEP